MLRTTRTCLSRHSEDVYSRDVCQPTGGSAFLITAKSDLLSFFFAQFALSQFRATVPKSEKASKRRGRYAVRSDFRSASGGERVTRNHAIPLTGTLYLSKYYSSDNPKDIRSDKYFSLSWKNRQRTNGELREDIVICFITGNFTI